MPGKPTCSAQCTGGRVVCRRTMRNEAALGSRSTSPPPPLCQVTQQPPPCLFLTFQNTCAERPRPAASSHSNSGGKRRGSCRTARVINSPEYEMPTASGTDSPITPGMQLTISIKHNWRSSRDVLKGHGDHTKLARLLGRRPGPRCGLSAQVRRRL